MLSREFVSVGVASVLCSLDNAGLYFVRRDADCVEWPQVLFVSTQWLFVLRTAHPEVRALLLRCIALSLTGALHSCQALDLVNERVRTWWGVSVQL